MEEEINEDIRRVLSQNPDDIQLENITSEEHSPLNEPVVEKDIGGNTSSMHANKEESKESDTSQTASEEYFYGNTDDAPKQEINEEYDPENYEDDFELPSEHAKASADAILAMANNFIGIGAGFFVKIHKHEEFYEFEEVIQLIDEENEKSVNLIKLDEEDKALLRPLLMQMMKAKAKKITAEQLLYSSLISIVIKKIHVIMENNSRKNALEEKFLKIVQEATAEKFKEEVKEEYDDFEEAEIKEEQPMDEDMMSSIPYQEFVEVEEDKKE